MTKKCQTQDFTVKKQRATFDLMFPFEHADNNFVPFCARGTITSPYMGIWFPTDESTNSADVQGHTKKSAFIAKHFPIRSSGKL